MAKDTTALIILDGFGHCDVREGNAIKLADTKNIDSLKKEYPSACIHASGLDVGLPEGQMGNSEVGHLNIGAGRIVYQDFTRISLSIKEGDFFNKKEFLDAIDNVKKHNSQLHIMGLLSDGGVHSHIEHLYALLELAKKHGLSKVFVHGFLDGRDVPPACAKQYIEALEGKMRELGIGKIATISGRYYAMDRDRRWDRNQKAYNAIVLGEGEIADNGIEAVDLSYNLGKTDEFVLPTVIQENGGPVAVVQPNDSVIFFNFRPDRARQITRSFIEKDFRDFERKNGYVPVFFVSMTQYDKTFENLKVAFKPQRLENTLGEYLSKLGKKQLRIAETEKYAHVTFFFNGGVEKPNEGEDRVLIPSPKVPTYDQKPEMSALEVTQEVINRIDSQKYDVIILNYANPDMVGHTGDLTAAIDAVEIVDKCVGKVIDAIRKQGGKAIITADHGNAELMRDIATGGTVTAHSTNPVPFILVDDQRKDVSLRDGGRLADIVPTMLDIMGIEKPEQMTGQTLIKK
ncbi:MAG: 2,3-bisphosphoglycerate-independent phosphoglycerate mutase [Clostridia bacterium]|nr:2,3-bisphosphoglycerate-independent phosphoglycerate mutase [Clostridia bacterium]